MLHYTQLEQSVPSDVRSFLIDAGAEYHGYAADLTRTYAAQSDHLFAQLIKDLNQEQQALIESMKVGVRYSDAGHHCWAFVAGAPDDSQQLGFSDDGEPSGTAGKPMLAQLMGSGIGEITAVSVRYYGGIPLGTGGLVKAYGGGVQQALKQVETLEKVLRTAYRLQCDYTLHVPVTALIRQMGGEVNTCDYGAEVTLQVAIPDSTYEETVRRLRDISRGTLQISII